MKNLLVILLLPLFVSCSKDDGGSNQTFLERFDGKVFQREMQTTQAPIGIIVDVHRYVKF